MRHKVTNYPFIPLQHLGGVEGDVAVDLEAQEEELAEGGWVGLFCEQQELVDSCHQLLRYLFSLETSMD